MADDATAGGDEDFAEFVRLVSEYREVRDRLRSTPSGTPEYERLAAREQELSRRIRALF
jgi:hypothetical protein